MENSLGRGLYQLASYDHVTQERWEYYDMVVVVGNRGGTQAPLETIPARIRQLHRHHTGGTLRT